MRIHSEMTASNRPRHRGISWRKELNRRRAYAAARHQSKMLRLEAKPSALNAASALAPGKRYGEMRIK